MHVIDNWKECKKWHQGKQTTSAKSPDFCYTDVWFKTPVSLHSIFFDRGWCISLTFDKEKQCGFTSCEIFSTSGNWSFWLDKLTAWKNNVKHFYCKASQLIALRVFANLHKCTIRFSFKYFSTNAWSYILKTFFLALIMPWDIFFFFFKIVGSPWRRWTCWLEDIRAGLCFR